MDIKERLSEIDEQSRILIASRPKLTERDIEDETNNYIVYNSVNRTLQALNKEKALLKLTQKLER